MSEKVLTITIPSYNVEKYLDRTLESMDIPDIMNDLEILVVNDGSKDNTVNIAQKYCDKYSESVFLVNKENGGHGSTINKGIELARGKYFKVVDGDDWIKPEALIKMIDVLKTSDVDMVLSPYERVYSGGDKIVTEAFEGVKYGVVYSFEAGKPFFESNYRMHTVTYRTELLKQIPKISEKCYYVDVEYIIYALTFLETLMFLPDTLYQYRCGEAEQSMNRHSMIKNRKMHEKVLFNMLNYCSSVIESNEKKLFHKKMLSKLARHHLDIYFSMHVDEDSKRELNRVTNYIKENYLAIYQDIDGVLPMLLRISDNRLYPLCAFFWKKIYHF